MNIAELRAKRDQIQAELERLNIGTPGGQQRADSLLDARDKIIAQIAQHERIERLAQHPANSDAGNPYLRPPAGRTRAVPLASDRESPDQQRRHAHMMISDHVRDDVLSTHAADALTAVVDNDPTGVESTYLRACAHPAYREAFGKMLVHGDHAPLRMTDDERRATEAVLRAQSMRAAATGGLGLSNSGGLAVPAFVDPSFTLTSSGSVNPMRQIARVVQTQRHEHVEGDWHRGHASRVDGRIRGSG